MSGGVRFSPVFPPMVPLIPATDLISVKACFFRMPKLGNGGQTGAFNTISSDALPMIFYFWALINQNVNDVQNKIFDCMASFSAGASHGCQCPDGAAQTEPQ